MFIIKSIEVEGFWGNSSIQVDLNPDVNIFIGKNGSGKTTFINLLEATLTGDVNRLSTYRFNKIKINLIESSHKRQIIVERNDVTNFILVKIGTSKFEFSMYDLNNIYRAQFGYQHPRNYNQKLLKDRLGELLGITYLSVHRNVIKKETDIIQDEQLGQQNPVDARLTDLMNRLLSYQLELQSFVNDLSKQFQRDILKLMLYNPNYDVVKIDSFISIDFEKLKRGLTQAYKDLGLLDDEQKQNINHHLSIIKRASDQINRYTNKEAQDLYVDDVTALTLMKRSEKIVELSSALEYKRNEIFEPIDSYMRLIADDFISNKTLKFSTGKKHDLVFTNDNKDFLPSQLSSGEKQLLILFTEALLQKRSKSIFIADEPELSLHISWQRKVISTLQLLNPNSQIILATHSPEIVGPLKSKTINMKDIII
ncbi:AAA family ATPase [Mucilaginibacter sp. ZT4R22]|uniref:AAA family ATPase n=1 Tax=Mucilaginibacter pankratovii TaxID=2772110 RepID=A0ABR7WND2_9SPHI|nr:AAA family ATPase [Mucilaginibacter pankratovii]MBD1362884.1 AAA family ATPase [Mucilaginibacter pankratovii]